MSRHCNLRYSLEVFLRETNGIGESKHQAKRDHGGVSPKIHSFGARTRYFGIAKDFVDKMNQKEIRRVNQVRPEDLIEYLEEKARRILYLKGGRVRRTTKKTIRTNLAALKKYFGISVWGGRKDLIEVLEGYYHHFLDLAGASGEAKPFSDPEKVIEKIKEPQHRAIAFIQYLASARIDDVPKVVESIKGWKEGNKPLIFIQGSKGGRNRVLDFKDRVEDFERVREAVALLAPLIEEKGWKMIKEDYYPDLRRAVAARGESYTGSHSFRVGYAQRWFREQTEERGLPEKEAIKRVTNDLGHNRIGVARGYIYR